MFSKGNSKSRAPNKGYFKNIPIAGPLIGMSSVQSISIGIKALHIIPPEYSSLFWIIQSIVFVVNVGYLFTAVIMNHIYRTRFMRISHKGDIEVCIKDESERSSIIKDYISKEIPH